ncbi:MAG TPA: AAA family ATPase [Thermodesulfobacteriota bacterium]|nr:phosphotransacetylase family protein [Deltaproteobacteria bacterium]HNR12246.1 AAA family ATPase [Thermodesulfobacteriota bacterium]HNU70082.1 AAA family ATPase [Thermodesulfobacteriota bacterium]HOC39402.1 AAA family ATPase [Thermodesulfobacteriota bacterium]
MQKIFVSSTGAGSGHSLAVWSLMEVFRSRGIRTGFFKPFVTRPVSHGGTVVDHDALLIKEYYQLPEPPEVLSPIIPEEVPGDEVAREEQLEKIDDCFQQAKDDNEVLVIMGSDQIFYEADSPYIADTSMVVKLDASVVLTACYQSESMTIYSVLAIESLLKNRLKMIIINQIPPEQLDTVQRRLGPLFSKRGLPPVFFLPQDRILSSVTVRQLIEVVGGSVLAGEDRLENLVETTSISSTHLKGSLNIFRRIYNKIILLGIEKEALSGPSASPTVTGIILTGGRTPAPLVCNTCEDLKVPLILSPLDTFITMERIQHQKMHVTHQDDYKLQRFLQLLGGEKARESIVANFTNL